MSAIHNGFNCACIDNICALALVFGFWTLENQLCHVSECFENAITTLTDLAKHVGRYPEEAFLFVREGLGFVTEQLHGPETPALRALHEYVAAQGIDWSDLARQYYDGSLPDPVIEARGSHLEQGPGIPHEYLMGQCLVQGLHLGSCRGRVHAAQVDHLNLVGSRLLENLLLSVGKDNGARHLASPST